MQPIFEGGNADFYVSYVFLSVSYPAGRRQDATEGVRRTGFHREARATLGTVRGRAHERSETASGGTCRRGRCGELAPEGFSSRRGLGRNSQPVKAPGCQYRPKRTDDTDKNGPKRK